MHRHRESVVVSPEMTLVIGRGPVDGVDYPADAVIAAFGLGSIASPASLWLGSMDQVRNVLGEDAGATRILILISPTAVARIEGRTLPTSGERRGWHLTSDLRAIALALRDCQPTGEAGVIYRTAKAVELVFETWRALDSGALIPLAGEGGHCQADSLRLLKARGIIDEQWSEKLSLEGIARACGLNREKLTRGFRDMFACTVAEAIAERRLQQASHMLLTTDLPVSSVGYENGYLNNASFARAFGRRFGVTPSDFRARRLAA
jgi:AraC family transcriptional activator of pyochelin receptor